MLMRQISISDAGSRSTLIARAARWRAAAGQQLEQVANFGGHARIFRAQSRGRISARTPASERRA